MRAENAGRTYGRTLTFSAQAGKNMETGKMPVLRNRNRRSVLKFMGQSDDTRPKTTFTWVAIIVIIFPVVAMVTPNLLPAKENRNRTSCTNNLRLIESAKEQWALENNKTNSETPEWKDVLPYLGRGGGVMPKCSQDGTYSLRPVGVHPTCSYPAHGLP